MPILGRQTELTNWSMTAQSPCTIYKACSSAEVIDVLTAAQTQGLSVIAHGAGHSYTDAALNTAGVVIDVTPMRRILAWDAEHGIMQVEPGVTVRDVVRVALPERWWLPVTPSTTEATIGGCVAMNVTGKNAWKCGAFGEHLMSLTVLLATGQRVTLSPASNPQLFQALVGSAGLLGIVISITLQLQRIPSENVVVRVRPATSFKEIVTIFQEEHAADFLEAWVDGFAGGRQVGRGLVTCTQFADSGETPSHSLFARIPDALAQRVARCIGMTCRPIVESGMRLANSVIYRWSTWGANGRARQRSLLRSTFYPPAAFTGYQTLLPQGIETFQAFVPQRYAADLFLEIVQRSQTHHFMPLWCVIKQHRSDPFLLSYQVDGFSLEVNYPIVPSTVHVLHQMLREFMDLVIAAGGRFYLAKDALLTPARYRQSIGTAAVETLLQIKQQYDPDMVFQSDLFRRVFMAGEPPPQPAGQAMVRRTSRSSVAHVS